jgi:UDP-3-O-[3-hydroxymyristoyl] glucosamine N-acyltransferase
VAVVAGATCTAAEMARRVGGELRGDADVVLRGVEAIDQAGTGHLTLITNEAYAAKWPACGAAAALVSRNLAGEAALAPDDGRALIFVEDADLAMAEALAFFAPPIARPQPGVHPSAIVDPTAQLGAGVCVGPLVLVGARVRLGDGCVIHGRVTVADDCAIGAGSELWPGVVVGERCVIGSRCILQPNVVIGADGFGYRPSRDPARPGLVKIPQIGTVRIGDDVEIGAGTCVDRGKFSATTIGDGTKIDNQCQIAHNCRVGRFCILAGQTGLAGSVTLGDGVVVGGRVAVKDHVTIGSGVRLAACSAVMDDVPAGETWGGYPAREAKVALREHAAMRKLPDLLKQWRGRGRG